MELRTLGRLAPALALGIVACGTAQSSTNPPSPAALDDRDAAAAENASAVVLSASAATESASAAAQSTSACCDAGLDGLDAEPRPTRDSGVDDAKSESPPTEGAWLGVYGPDVTTGEFRTWLVDANGTRTELTPFGGANPVVFETDGELVLIHQAAVPDGLQVNFHRISGGELLAPASRTFPLNSVTSNGWGYASAVHVLESEQHVFESGVTAPNVLSSELMVFDGVDPAGLLITDRLPPFELPRFALPFWSPETSELFYPEATNDDIENPTWKIQRVKLAGRDVSMPETVIENAIWPQWSSDRRWLTMTTIDDPWALSTYATPRQQWLIERGTWQRYDLGIEAAGEETTWRFTSNSKWLVGERRNESGSIEVRYRRVPDGEPQTLVAAGVGGSVMISGDHSKLSRLVIEERDATNTHLRSHYADFEGDEPEIEVVEGPHTMNWPGRGDLVVVYVADDPFVAPGPETTGIVKLYRTLPKPENLLFEGPLNYWLMASAADEHFVFHTEDGWFSLPAQPGAEPTAIDIGDEFPQISDARNHPTRPLAAILAPDSQNHLRLMSWPDGQPHSRVVEFPELEWLTAYWVEPARAPFVALR